jgi:hypothetical protein
MTMLRREIAIKCRWVVVGSKAECKLPLAYGNAELVSLRGRRPRAVAVLKDAL